MTSFDTICNSTGPPLVDIVYFCLLRIVVSLTILKRINYGGSNPISISALHRPMTSFDTICNSTSPLLADIVHFGLLRIVVSFTVLKCVY